MRFQSIALAMTTVLSLSAASVLAQEAAPAPIPASESNPFVTRGAALPAILRFLQTDGIKLTYLGDDGGLKGYIGESASGRNQALYPTPDGDHVLAGILFRSGGAQVTLLQIDSMLKRFNEAAQSVDGIDPEVFADTVDGEPKPLVDKPIMEWLAEAGNKVTDLQSKDGGLDAYLVESPAAKDGSTGLMQVFYVLPDDRYAIAGMLMGRDGQQVTGIQLGRLQERFLAEEKTASQNGSAISPGVNPMPVPATTFPAEPAVPSDVVTPAVPAAPALAPQSTSEIEDTGGAMAAALLESLGGVNSAQELTAATTDVALPAPVFPDVAISTQSPEAADQWKSSDISADFLLTEIGTKTNFFTLGAGPGLPTVWMVADPQCPYCHEAWRQLKPLVFAKKIQLRVVMIAGLKGSDPISRSILSMEHPDMAWLQGQGSVAGVAVPEVAVGSPQFNLGGQRLQENDQVLSAFNITQTPFLAYVTDDQAYVSRGLPASFDAFLAALK